MCDYFSNLEIILNNDKDQDHFWFKLAQLASQLAVSSPATAVQQLYKSKYSGRVAQLNAQSKCFCQPLEFLISLWWSSN